MKKRPNPSLEELNRHFENYVKEVDITAESLNHRRVLLATDGMGTVPDNNQPFIDLGLGPDKLLGNRPGYAFAILGL